MRILFFSSLYQFTGIREKTLSENAPTTTDELWAALESCYPGISDHRPMTRLACNEAFIANDAVFMPDDEIALIPPVSGG
jgi:molybdopterin converting factor small subunit